MPRINPTALEAVVRCLRERGRLTARDIVSLARTKGGKRLKFLVIHHIKQMAVANPHLIGIERTTSGNIYYAKKWKEEE